MAKRGERIPVEWIKGLRTEEEKDARIAVVAQSLAVLDVLRNIIDARLEEVERKMVHDYSNPAWPYHQASLLGQKEAYEELKKILPSDKFLDSEHL